MHLGCAYVFCATRVARTSGAKDCSRKSWLTRLFKCFVIIDLKIGKVTHQDIGQMQMYVNYYDREIINEDENPTVGILLSSLKNKTVVKYTLPENNKSIFAATYKLHLPTEQELIDAVEEEKKNLELNKENT